MNTHFPVQTKNFIKIFSLVFFLAASVFVAKGQSLIINTVAGNGIAGYSGDGGQAISAQLNQPNAVAVDGAGNVYIADGSNNVVRKVDINGIITTVAGTGVAGYSGDSGPATSAQLNGPFAVKVDGVGNLYIADAANNVIRKVNTSGIISTIVGTGAAGYSGDGGPATAATLNYCSGVALDPVGNIFISDDNNDYIRRVDASTGIITTIAGTGTCEFTGDGGPAINAGICFPVGVSTDASGNVYLADLANYVIRKINVSTGIITTVAGNGSYGFSGDGGLATSAQLSFPFDVTFDASGNMFIADWANYRIRKVDASTGIISTYAGNGGGGYSGDGGSPTVAQIGAPEGVAFDTNGNLLIADQQNSVVRKVSISQTNVNNTCSNALAINSTLPNGMKFSDGITNENTAWFSFVAESVDEQIIVVSNNSNSASNFANIEIFTGTCQSLNLLTQYNALADTLHGNNDSLYGVIQRSLIIGNTYYVKLSRSTSDQSTFKIYATPNMSTTQSCTYNLNDLCMAPLVHYSPRFTGAMSWNGCAPGLYFVDLKVVGGNIGQFSNFGMSIETTSGNFVGLGGLDPSNQHSNTGIFYNPPVSSGSSTIYDYLDYNVNSGNSVGGNVQIQVKIIDLAGSTISGTSQLNLKIVAPMSVPFSSVNYCTASPLTLSVNNDPNYDYAWFLSNQFGVEQNGSPVGFGPTITLNPPPQYSPVWIESAGLNSGKCLGQGTSIIINPTTPTPSQVIIVKTHPTTFCSGASALFSISGVTNYIITNNHDNTVIHGNTPTISVTLPFLTVQQGITYKVYSSMPDCANPGQITLTVLPVTDFNVSASPKIICPNQPVTLSAVSTGGNQNFNWSGPSLNFSCNNSVSCSTSVSPAVTTVYTATGINSFGCALSKPVTVNVTATSQIGLGNNPSTAIQVATDFSLCQFAAGNQYFSSINGAQTYFWDITPHDGNFSFTYGSQNTQSIGLFANNPNKNQTYVLTLTVTDFLPGGGGACPQTSSINIKPCCSAASTGFTPISSLNGVLTPGNYIVTGSLYVGSSSTISNSNFIMNPGSSIIVADNLSINKTHFFACSDMWQGFGIDGSSHPNPTLTITNSLIEDAIYGINVVNPPFIAQNYQAKNPNIILNNTWFNRCAVGIANDFDPINSSNSPTNNSASLSLNNCVFTDRNNITMSGNVIPHNTTFNFFTQNRANLHNFLFKSNYVSFVGLATGGQSANTSNYLIKNCFFDNMVDGILAGSSITVQKCTFQFILLDPSTENNNYITANFGSNYGVGIGNILKPGGCINFNPTGTNNQLTVGGAGNNGNTFLICNYGVISFDDEINITNNSFKGTQISGILHTVTSPQTVNTIANNTFDDHFNRGIDAFFALPSNSARLDITNNTFNISNSFYSGNNITYARLPEAIFITSPGNIVQNPGNSRINVGSNNINNYQLGITAQTAHTSNINGNSISMFEDNTISTNVNNFTHGISAVNCDGTTISQNDITSINTVNSFKYGQFGIFTENSVNALISCNTIKNVDISLKCQGSNNRSTIQENTFQKADIFAYWLDIDGFVGPQGHGGSPGFTNANKFVNVGPFGLGAFASNGSNGSNSPFFYINNGVSRPIPSDDDHLTNTINPGTKIPTGGAFALSPLALSPLPCPVLHRPNPSPLLSNNVAQQIATNTLQFTQFNSTATFGNRLDLYRNLVADGSASYSGDAILTAFVNSMPGTSHAQLLATDTLTANAGNDTAKINVALSVNSSIAPTGNYDTYLKKINNLYGQYLKRKGRLSSVQVQDIRDIALLCPFEFGEGVYRARALLSRFDTLKYINTCEQNQSLPSSNARLSHSIQQTEEEQINLKVYPNPASNHVYVEGLQTTDNDKVEFIAYNNLGQVVIKTNLVNNTSGSQVVDIGNLMNGTYVFKVIQNGAVIHLNKLVVLK